MWCVSKLATVAIVQATYCMRCSMFDNRKAEIAMVNLELISSEKVL